MHYMYFNALLGSGGGAILCYAAPCEDEGQVDLITSSGSISSTGIGVVNVCVNRSKGTVCEHGWGFAEASVTCKAAGYSHYGKQFHEFTINFIAF